jgi:prenyltransferase beta subunit
MIRVGRGLMPSYGARITHFDRWHVVNYVRQLQRSAGTFQAQAAEVAEDGDARTADGGDR